MIASSDGSGGGTAATGRCFSFDTSFVGTHGELTVGRREISEVNISPLGRKKMMVAQMAPQNIDVDTIDIGEESHSMRHPHIDSIERKGGKALQAMRS